jgi:hypothetical protein
MAALELLRDVWLGSPSILSRNDFSRPSFLLLSDCGRVGHAAATGRGG